MGYFPYECTICGGAYNRCGNRNGIPHDDLSPDEPCRGGQECWEDNVIMKIKDQYIRAKYEGYGGAIVKDHGDLMVHSLEFEEFFASWDNVKYIAESFTCESCFTSKFGSEKINELSSTKGNLGAKNCDCMICKHAKLIKHPNITIQFKAKKNDMIEVKA